MAEKGKQVYVPVDGSASVRIISNDGPSAGPPRDAILPADSLGAKARQASEESDYLAKRDVAISSAESDSEKTQEQKDVESSVAQREQRSLEIAAELGGEGSVDYGSAEEEPKEEGAEELTAEIKRVPTGIRGFDELVNGGFESRSISVIVGSAGTGKTIFSLQFLYNGATKYGEPGVMLSFEEEKESLFKHSLQFGWDFGRLEKEGKFKLLVFKPHQVTAILEEGGGQIKDTLIQLGAKRLVIDSITAYALLFKDEYERREKILEFYNLIRKWGITAIVISEDDPKSLEKEEGSISFISDAMISMYYQHDEEKGIRIHSLEIVKMRGTEHANKLCAVNFEKEGIVIYPEVEVF